MTPAFIDGLRALAPELVLGITAFLALAAGMRFSVDGLRRFRWIAIVGIAVAALLSIARIGQPATTVMAMLEVDGFGSFFKLLLTLATAAVALSWTNGHPGMRAVPAEEQFFLLAALLGAFLMVGTTHALLLVLGFELLSISSYALAGLGNQRSSSGDAKRRFIVCSSLASGLMIYGVSLLYGLTGTLDFARMGVVDAASDAAGLAQQIPVDAFPVAIALLLIFAGLAAKISLAPLHAWTAEAIDGSPPAVGTFLSLVPSIASLGALLRFLSAVFVQDGSSAPMVHYAGRVSFALAILAAATMTAGNLSALRQPGLRRLVAYAWVAQAGYAMIGVATCNETGFGSALVFIALSALIGVGVCALSMHFEAIAGSDRLEDMRGLGWRTPLAGVAMIVLLAAWIGFPPTVGFYGRVRLFMEGWNAGLSWLVVVAAINTLAGALVVMRVVRILFQDSPSATEVTRARVLLTIAVTLSIAVVVFGLWTRPLDQWANSGLDLLRGSR